MYPFLFFDRFLRNILYYKFFLNYSIKIKLKPMLHKIMFFSKLIKKTYRKLNFYISGFLFKITFFGIITKISHIWNFLAVIKEVADKKKNPFKIKV